MVFDRVVAWLAAAAIAFHAFLPLLHQPVAGPPGSSLLSGLIVLCTPFGYKTVSVPDFDGGAPEPQTPQPKAPLCPICLSAQLAGTAVVPPAFALLVPSTESVAFHLAAKQDVRHHRVYSPHSPRAPPILS